MKGIVIILYIMLQVGISLQAQQNVYPVIGKPLPPVYFTEVQYYQTPYLNTQSLRGKWLVLYAWNRYCSLCINKMPLLSNLQSKFADKLNVLLVGYNGSRYTKKSDDQEIRRLYERNKIEMNLKLSIAYDSLMFHQFNIGSSPYILIVNPEGIVCYITTGFSEYQLKEILEGREVVLRKAYRRDERFKLNE